MPDMLAKAGSQLPQPDSSTSYNEAETVLKQKFKTNWQNRHNGYCPRHDHISKLERREQTTIFRLRTGHCDLEKHQKKMALYALHVLKNMLRVQSHICFSSSAINLAGRIKFDRKSSNSMYLINCRANSPELQHWHQHWVPPPRQQVKNPDCWLPEGRVG